MDGDDGCVLVVNEEKKEGRETEKKKFTNFNLSFCRNSWTIDCKISADVRVVFIAAR